MIKETNSHKILFVQQLKINMAGIGCIKCQLSYGFPVSSYGMMCKIFCGMHQNGLLWRSPALEVNMP
jgi:hypothetical protein